ncbi:MAG: hypothetical protein BGN83_05785 [Rhizobium sp. 63-7]|nr:MAG: hypothetical protein BGN83_05785 [Rhizobium sp. 63-7]
MGDLLIRNIDEALKRGIIELAQTNGRSLSDEAKALIGEAMAGKRPEPQPELSAWDALRPILADIDPAEAEEYARIMEEVEAERKRDFGRPLADIE